MLTMILMTGALVVLGCNEREEDICSTHLPRLRHELSSATLALKPWLPDESFGRSVASLEIRQNHEKNREGLDFSQSDRASWAAWSMKRLTEFQKYGDLISMVSQRREFKFELQSIGAQWVVFHGQAEQGNAIKMEATLQRIRIMTETAIISYCE